MIEIDEKELFTTHQLAIRLHYSPTTIRRIIERGGIKACRPAWASKNRTKWIITGTEVIAFLKNPDKMKGK